MLTDQSKLFEEDQLRKIVCCRGKKENLFKEEKGGKQLTILAAFGTEKAQQSDSSTESNDNDVDSLLKYYSRYITNHEHSLETFLQFFIVTTV